ncbi:uncharacterized protein [Magallana gigas]|uniref:uncharacterized protein isoform X3 n=1 Tax=Magallana gigas TaxID=29159 RepID=UPI00148A68E1|nr:uncharacterized protein LOC105333439 isoform X3 [Crassostrea gigas]
MDLVGSRFSLLLTIEILTLTVYVFCILLNVICGSKFSQRDTIFSAVVFVVCCVILVATVVLACRARTTTRITQTTKAYRKLQQSNQSHYDYHRDCIEECFKKTRDPRCPKCRRAHSGISSLTSQSCPTSLSAPVESSVKRGILMSMESIV